jgi:hypothetical protein
MTNPHPQHNRMRPFSINGQTYYHPTRAAEIVGLHATTLTSWAKAGITSFGFELEVVPYGPHLAIPEAKVLALKELLRDFPLNRHGPISGSVRGDLRRAACLYAVPSTTPQP